MPPTSPRASSRSTKESNGNREGRPSSGRSTNRRERRAAKRSVEGLNGAGDTPVASGSSSPRAKESDSNAKGASKNTVDRHAKTTTFEENHDFIPFSDMSGDEAGPSKSTQDRSSKGKDTGRGREREDADERDDAETRTSGKSRRKSESKSESTMSERARDKSKMREPSSRTSASGREWDRGKERMEEERGSSRNANGKRRHDEYDDGYANKKQRMDAASRKCPWINVLELQRSQNVAEMMHREVEAFLKWISPTPVEDEVRGLIVDQVAKCVTLAFPDAAVYPFGSYQTKLYLPLGDIDLVALSDSMAYSDKATVLHILANALKRHGITSHVTIIAKAKVPIVKFITTHGRFKVDISINQGNGLVSGQIITGFLKDMIPSAKGRESKALRSLVMITKAFLSQRSMNEVYTGGLGSYAIVCLAVSFLQMHPKIRRGEIDPEKNLGVLVMEFFELYGNHFNYDEVGISLRDGGTYFNKRQRGWHAEYKRNMLSIEDPADPSNDISSGSYNFHKVKTAFSGCHGILTSTAYMRAGILNSRRSGRSVPLRGHYESDDLSILSTVMGITQETINHRRLVQELYERGVLHNILGVKPKPIVIDADSDSENEREHEKRKKDSTLSSTSKSKSSHAVKTAWEDVHRNSDSDDYEEHSTRDRHSHSHSRRDGHREEDDERVGGEDDGGRYAIGRQPPKKRPRTGRPKDSHTVYFVNDDDEEEEELKYGDGEDEDDEEEGEYMSDESEEDVKAGERSPRKEDPKKDARRSYWLSKALSIGGVGVDVDSN